MDTDTNNETYYIYDETGAFYELVEGESDEEIRAWLDSEGKEDWTFDKGSE